MRISIKNQPPASEIIAQIKNEAARTAFKSMYTDMSTGKAILNPEQFGQFIQILLKTDPILTNSTYYTMRTPQKVLNRISVQNPEDIIQDGYIDDEEQHNVQDNIDAVTFDFGGNVLNPILNRTKIEIGDDEREDNIEGDNIENTMFNEVANAWGRGLTYLKLYSDKDNSTANIKLRRRDGLLKQAGQQLESKGINSTDGNFDVADGILEVFDSMIFALPEEARDNNLTFYVPYEVYKAYANTRSKKDTAYADEVMTKRLPLFYDNIPIEISPAFNSTQGRTTYGGVPIMLTNPKNIALGVRRDLTIEPERIPSKNKDVFWYNMRSDVQYILEDYTCVAKLTTEEAAALPKASRA